MEMQARGARSSVWQTGCGAKGDVEGEVAGVPPTPRWLIILGGSKITADGDCSHEIKTLVPWKKSYDQPR